MGIGTDEEIIELFGDEPKIRASFEKDPSKSYEDGILEVAFKSGSVYQYSGVPESVYDALMTAPSHCKYFAAFIRNNYPYRQVR